MDEIYFTQIIHKYINPAGLPLINHMAIPTFLPLVKSKMNKSDLKACLQY